MAAIRKYRAARPENAAAGIPYSPLEDGSTWKGRVGMGMQVGSALLTGYSAIREADAAIKNASAQYQFTASNVFDTYAQLFEELGENNRRMYAAQDVAVGASGLAAEGSIMRVLDETIEAAKKQRTRLESAEQAAITQAAYEKRMAKKIAKRRKRYGVVSAGLQLGLAAFGPPGVAAGAAV